MKKLTLFFFAMIIVEFAKAQITFQKTYGGTLNDYGYSGQQTADGGYIITGSSNSFGSIYENIFLIKTDSNGDTLWTKTYSESLFGDVGVSVKQTTDGGFIIAGTILIKTDSVGNLLWSKSISGSSVQQTGDGGYIIVGSGGFGPNIDVYVVKTDANGDTLWTKTLGVTNNYLYGFSVQQTTDGGYIIGGKNMSLTTGGYTDVYLAKTDSGGNLLWSKFFGGFSYDYGNSVQQATDGGYIITGGFGSIGAGYNDVYLIKTDSIGNLLWSQTYRGSGYDSGNSVQQTTDGGYIISGVTDTFAILNCNVYLIKTDSNGNILWSKTFGSTSFDKPNSVQQTTDGGYIITGNKGNFGAGYNDVYLIKTDSLGNSGCNQTNPATIVNSPATIVTNPASTVASFPINVLTSATIVGSGGGLVTTLCFSAGINEIAINNSFIVSPNPSSGSFTILFEKRGINGSIEILNIFGNNIFSERIYNESNKQIHLGNITDGIYFVKVFDSERSYCKKLIVAHD